MNRQQTETEQSNPAAAPPLVVLEGVDVARVGSTILRDLTWKLEAGRHWGIVGDNGSGKSTLLALIAGNVWPAPDTGTRRYDFGHGPQTDAVEARRSVAIVGAELQDRYTRWGWNFTTEQVVLSGLYRTDVPRARPSPADLIRVRALLRELDLVPLTGRRFLELSRGEQRRVLIARALAFRPRVLLLDEPANGLDSRSRRALDALIARAAERCTIVCSAHAIAGLPAAITDVLRLADGRIVSAGPRAAARIPAPASDAAAGERVAAANGPSQHRERLRNRAGPTRPAPAAVELEHVDVWLEDHRVLADVSWTLAPGQHWLVVGANGAGKSTFLKLLHGQLRPALGGTVRWPALGDPRNVWRVRRLVAFASSELQAGYLYPATVRTCIASGFDSSIGLTRGLSPAERARVDELLGRFGLVQLAERAVSSLSHGQMHRTLLARTLVNRPRVLLLDEPWEGLDAPTRDLVVGELEAAMAEGAQLVCASHLGAEGLPFTHELTIAHGRIATRALTD